MFFIKIGVDLNRLKSVGVRVWSWGLIDSGYDGVNRVSIVASKKYISLIFNGIPRTTERVYEQYICTQRTIEGTFL